MILALKITLKHLLIHLPILLVISLVLLFPNELPAFSIHSIMRVGFSDSFIAEKIGLYFMPSAINWLWRVVPMLNTDLSGWSESTSSKRLFSFRKMNEAGTPLKSTVGLIAAGFPTPWADYSCIQTGDRPEIRR